MIRIGIIGGAGYVAGELMRILIHHPEADIVFVQSNSQNGKRVDAIHHDLVGDMNLVFTNDLANHPAIDLLYLCGGHGKSRAFMDGYNVPADVKIIDLSRDYRLKDTAEGYVYGLPELNKGDIKSTNKLANPGCFATCIQLGLLPLAANGALKNDVHVNAITGSTGAGAIPAGTTHFSWRNNNISIYKAFKHQHMDEIIQSAVQLQSDLDVEIDFLPMRGNFTRGIYASIYMKTPLSKDDLGSQFIDFYGDHPFVHVVESDVNLKQVVNTNKCIIQVQKIDGKVLIISMIDNLLKGAAGQAVQNMNLMFGLDEKTGLNLKSVGF